MIANRQYRKLTTILAADVVGYSRLVANDDSGTVQRLNTILNTVLPDLAAPCRGRVVKRMGDGILMEFGSVVEAVNCAVDMQDALSGRQDKVAHEQRIDFRMGINVGDVIVDGDDIFGTGVNVAARIEALADRGSILVSRAVHEQVKDIVPHRFEALGRKRVKNITDPVEIFRLVPQGTPLGFRRGFGRPRDLTLTAVATVGALALGTYGGFALMRSETDSFAVPPSPVTVERTAITVLPLRDMSVQSSYDHLADAITGELITGLSKLSGLSVIASPRKDFLDRDLPATDGEDGMPRYVLDGTVQRVGPAIRVNTKVIDTWTGVHIWAERFHGDASDVFTLQDRIVISTVNAVRLKVADQLVQ